MEHLAGWRSVSGGSGGLCVMTLGIIQKQLLSVDNLDSVQRVILFILLLNITK